MGVIVNIEDHGSHIAERAQCRACMTSWVAVISSGANLWLLECPKCHLMHGHIPHAWPDTPYDAKVWTEQIWRYLTEGILPDQQESQPETDGDAAYAMVPSTPKGSILTARLSRWTTSCHSGTEDGMGQTTSEQPINDATIIAGQEETSSTDLRAEITRLRTALEEILACDEENTRETTEVVIARAALRK